MKKGIGRPLRKVIQFVKKETVLVIAALLAIASMILVPPNAQYFNYIDYSVIGILFCLMLAVAGFMELGMLDSISAKLITKARNVKILRIILINCVFFSSMFFTNDVALIAFVPVTIGIFHFIGRDKLISTVVLETIAANIGSMLTPIGNPQNLYLYSFYHIHILDFWKTVLPVGIVGYLVIMCILFVSKSGSIEVSPKRQFDFNNKKALLAYFSGIFILCVLTVLRVIDYRICVAVVLVSIIILDRKLFKKVDYGLLLTFAAFFIFVGNIEQLPVVKDALSSFLSGRVLGTSIISSQVISNVPAAMMISRFTDDARNVLLGVNIGGIGTLIASLASLISFKLYAKSDGASPVKYLGVFTVYNVAVLILLLLAAVLL